MNNKRSSNAERFIRSYENMRGLNLLAGNESTDSFCYLENMYVDYEGGGGAIESIPGFRRNNTIEAVLYCKEKGIGAYQGGTCNETDRSAQVCVHCAMATKPDQILAKPGMGVDEGYMIVYNEMNRIMAMRAAKKGV